MTVERAEKIVLAVDFLGRRPEGRVVDLQGELHGFRLVELLGELDAADLSPSCLAHTVDVVAQRYDNVVGVIGYCLAVPIASRVATSVGAPCLIGIEAQDPTFDVFTAEVVAMRDSILNSSSTLPPWWETAADEEADQLFDRCKRLLQSDIEKAVGMSMSDEPSIALLLETYGTWISFLLAARASMPNYTGSELKRRNGLETFVLASASNSISAGWNGNHAQLETVDTDRVGLFKHARTAQIIRRWLSGPEIQQFEQVADRT